MLNPNLAPKISYDRISNTSKARLLIEEVYSSLLKLVTPFRFCEGISKESFAEDLEKLPENHDHVYNNDLKVLSLQED